MHYTTKIALFVLSLLVTGLALARQPGYKNRNGEVPPPVTTDRYGPPGYSYELHGNIRNWDGYGADDYRTDHGFWRGRWADEPNLSSNPRREMLRKVAYYDQFRLDSRDTRFEPLKCQKCGDMPRMMTPWQGAVVLRHRFHPASTVGRGILTKHIVVRDLTDRTTGGDEFQSHQS